MGKITLAILLTLILLIISGCCNWEEEMHPLGLPMYGMAVLAGDPALPPAALAGYVTNGSFDTDDWTPMGGILGWSYDLDGYISFYQLVDIICSANRCQVYYGPGADPNNWNYRSKSYWTMNPDPPGLISYYFRIKIDDIIVIPTTIVYLVLVDGPGTFRGVSPKVTGVSPV